MLHIFAGVAQSVVQLIRNQQVVCSSHITSSKNARGFESRVFLLSQFVLRHLISPFLTSFGGILKKISFFYCNRTSFHI